MASLAPRALKVIRNLCVFLNVLILRYCHCLVNGVLVYVTGQL